MTWRKCFKGLKKRDWTLSISDKEERPVLKMNICKENKEDDKVFHIIQSCCITVDAEWKRKKYTVDVTV